MVEFPLCLTGATAVIPASRVRIVPTPFSRTETNKQPLDRNTLCSLFYKLNSSTLRGREQAEESQKNSQPFELNKASIFPPEKLKLKRPNSATWSASQALVFFRLFSNLKLRPRSGKFPKTEAFLIKIENSST